MSEELQRVALLGPIACEQEALLRSKLTSPVAVAAFPGPEWSAECVAGLARADILVTLRYHRSMPPVPKVRFVQVAGAGCDEIDFDRLPAGAIVSNAFGHEDAVAEYVILAMLLWCTRFAEAERTFRAGSWARSGRTGSPPVEEVGGKTVGIIGYGHIGRAVARRAGALGARVLVCTRSRDVGPAAVRHVGDLAHVDALLRESDFVVLCCPLVPETSGLIDARRLGLMRENAVLINVARGQLVDERALFEALQARTIAGAILDTWYHYPTPENPNPAPSRFPFHELSNVYMTPHSSAWTTQMLSRRWGTIADNIDRVVRGEIPHNVVARPSGHDAGDAFTGSPADPGTLPATVACTSSVRT